MSDSKFARAKSGRSSKTDERPTGDGPRNTADTTLAAVGDGHVDTEELPEFTHGSDGGDQVEAGEPHTDDDLSAFVESECALLGIASGADILDRWRTPSRLLADVRKRIATGKDRATAFRHAVDAADAQGLANWMVGLAEALADARTEEFHREVLREQMRNVQRTIIGDDHDTLCKNSESATTTREELIRSVMLEASAIKGAVSHVEHGWGVVRIPGERSPVRLAKQDPSFSARADTATNNAIRRFASMYPDVARKLSWKRMRETVLAWFDHPTHGKFERLSEALRNTSVTCTAKTLQTETDRIKQRRRSKSSTRTIGVVAVAATDANDEGECAL